MGSNSSSTNLFDSLHQWCRAEHGALSSNKLYERPYRMEASFYTSDGYTSLNAMRNSGFTLQKIGDIATVWWFGPFARRYVSDPAYGVPFLSSSNMMEARPKSYNLISKKNTKNLEKYVVKEGDILISRSGTIGNIALVTKDMGGWTVSEHAIRVIVRDAIDLGTVYCFLQSSLGQFLIQRSMSGSVVQSIYEADISNLSIPKFPLRLRQELTKSIKEVSDLRVEANHLLDEAEKMIQQQLELPDIEYFDPLSETQQNHNATIFSVEANDNIIGLNQFGRCRLDATYHEPGAVKIKKFILSKPEGQLLGQLLKDVRNSNLRKRIYVDEPENGVPLLGGKQLTQIRPSDINYLSSSLTRGLKKERVANGWILVSCGGTIGRTFLVHKNYDQYVFTQDVMRLIIEDSKSYSGFVFSYLSSWYGQTQLLQASYGSVQKKLRDFQFRDIAIILPEDKGLSIHEKTLAGFEKRAEALEKENAAFDLFMTAIREGREATEAQWGSEE